jgi:hypothetical protein
MKDITNLSASFIFLQMPLYGCVAWDPSKVFEIAATIYSPRTLDIHCVDCGKHSTFASKNKAVPVELTLGSFQRKQTLAASAGTTIDLPLLPNGTFEVIFCCARNESHQIRYVFLILWDQENKESQLAQSIIKIGQHPSFGDLVLPELTKYSPVLNKQVLGEFKRGLGLASHDVGIGAFVYLRRVFEYLLEEAHQITKGTIGWDEENYNKSRTSERIQALREYLPVFLVKNPVIYSLLSKGLHELTEQECLEHFDVLRICIEIILDEKVESKQKAEKHRQAKLALQAVINKVSGDGT